MKAESNAISFRPLKGGRFRVITRGDDGKTKPGRRIKPGQTKRTRSAHESERLHRLKPKTKPVKPSPPQPSLPKAEINPDGSVRCPFCSWWHPRIYVRAGEMKCGSCDSKFIATPAQPNLNLSRARIDDEGDVRCPHCRMWKLKVSLGETECRHCRERFIAFC